MIETLANAYSSESTQRELSNEYQHDRVKMIFKNVCILVLWTKVASALEGLMSVRRLFHGHWTTSLMSVGDCSMDICILRDFFFNEY